MKRQSICAWASVIALAFLLLSSSTAMADSTNETGSHRLVNKVKGAPVVADESGDSGTPEIQYGDPDDLGGGDQKGGDIEPPIGDPSGDLQGAGELEWHQAIYEIFKAFLFTL